MSTTNKQVAHIFAQGNGGSAKGSNFYCEDNRLYSYSTLIGCIIDGTIFLSLDNMTPTTGKQLGYARSACSYNCFATPCFTYGSRYGTPTATQLITAAAEAMSDRYTELLRKRKPDTDSYTKRRQEIIDIAERFNVSLQDIPEAGEDLTAKAVAFQANQRKANAERKRRAEESARAQRIIDQGQLDTWLQLGRGNYPRAFRQYGEPDQFTIKNGRTGLEINQTANTIVTSQGAECPLDHAIKALKFYRSRDISDHNTILFTPYHTNGHKIPLGVFTLDSIDEAGTVKAGCHTFTAQEIDRFINQWQEVLGL